MENMYKRIKEVCKQKGMSLSEVAERSGIARETLSRQVSGNPTVNTLIAVAKALNVQVHELFTDESLITGVVRVGNQVHLINSLQDLEKLIEEIQKPA